MNLRRRAAAPALFALAAGLIAAWGCNKKPTVPLVSGNEPPSVRITSAPIDTTLRNYYLITLNWIGFDPDGRVDHFLVAVDPPKDPGVDTLWESTTDNTLTRSFPCPLPDHQDPTRSSDFHVFVIKAVDNQGALSPPVARAFWSFTTAPRVEVRVPPANSLVRYYLPPSFIFRWEGFDDDGVFTQKPVKYKFKLLSESPSDFAQSPVLTARATPDSVRRYYAPRHWAGWDSVGGDTTLKQYTDQDVGKEFVFVVMGFDEAGAYSPIFSLSSNMIYLRVTFAGAQNPRIGFFNEFFNYEYAQGAFQPNNPAQVVQLEVPAGEPGNPNDKLTFNWYASPATDFQGNPVGGSIRSYRWAVDIVNLEDDTERTSEDDLAHWSQPTSDVTSCRIGPYPGGETHKFYLEAEDINDLVSLGTVQFTTVQATFAKPLLIVDDTRYLLDRIAIATNCYATVNQPLGKWPSAAELDTFLYAVGGVPWKCYPPQGAVLSTPGLFNGYPFDTIGTRLGIEDLTVRLSTLGRYQHVIWLVDALGAQNDKPGTNKDDCQTAMRYMNNQRKSNTLAAYVRQGGLVWLVGQTALASLNNFNKTNNDVTGTPRTKTFTFENNELIPGRFVYDQGHWRSEFKWFKLSGRLKRYLGRFESEGVTGHDQYAGLPVEIQIKSPATDPFPPNSANRSQSDFYQTQFDVEFLSATNEILEDLDSGAHENFQATLDTLYKVTGVSLQPDTGPGALQSVVMTRYRGLDNAEFLLTGFNLWNFRRQQCRDLVDFVLQHFWNFAAPVPVRASAAMPVRAPGLAAGAPRAPGVSAGAARAAPLRQAPPAPATTGTRD